MNLEVKIIAENDANMGERFGITKSRCDELGQVVSDSFMQNNMDAVQAIADVSKVATHPNELAFMCFAIGGFYENSSSKMKMLNNLMNVLKH